MQQSTLLGSAVQWLKNVWPLHLSTTTMNSLLHGLQVLFADTASTPRTIAFAHAASPVAQFQQLGVIHLQSQGASPLQHVFQLGSTTTILKFLRLTFSGTLAATNSGEFNPKTKHLGWHQEFNNVGCCSCGKWQVCISKGPHQQKAGGEGQCEVFEVVQNCARLT